MSAFRYQEKHSLAKRKAESSAIMIKYPQRIPVICEAISDEIKIDKSKFITPADLTYGQFVYVIRKRAKIKPEETIYLMLENNIAPSQNMSMAQIYNQYASSDGFIYIKVMKETSFG